MVCTSMICQSLSGNLEWYKNNQQNCTPEITEMTFMSALHYGALECIQYMVENGLVDIKNKPYCDIATKRGHYECLKYLYENGCPFRKYTALIAMIREDYDCLRYILSNGGEIHMPSE